MGNKVNSGQVGVDVTQKAYQSIVPPIRSREQVAVKINGVPNKNEVMVQKTAEEPLSTLE
jgi:hypothetical protein